MWYIYHGTVIDFTSLLNTTVDPFIVLFDAVPPGGDRSNKQN